MKKDQIHRYALALALVPDEDVAGDLYMQSQSDRELLHRANAWRRREGLDLMEAPEVLPSLTPEQEEHALHLLRRGGLRRRLQAVGVALAAAGVLAGFLFGALASPDTKGLLTDANFDRPPQVASNAIGGTRLMVYRAESTPESVTIWWELRGGAAAQAGEAVEPVLLLDGARAAVKPQGTERSAPRPDRMVARSEFKTIVTTATGGEVRLSSGTGDWAVRMQLERATGAPLHVVIPVGQEVQIPTGGILKVESLEVGPQRTVLRFQSTSPFPVFPLLADADGGRMHYRNTGRQSGGRSGASEAYFAALPPSTRTLQFQVSQAAERLGGRTIPLMALREFEREGISATARLTLAPEEVLVSSAVFLVDDRGREYRSSGIRAQAVGVYRAEFTGISAEANLVSLRIAEVGRIPQPLLFTLDITVRQLAVN